MKKLLACLLVFVFVVAGIFATETHQLTIKADVTETLPAFNLTIGSLNTNSTATNVYSLTTANSYDITTAHTDATAANAHDAGFNLNEDGSFTVIAKIINAVKSNRLFTLEFSGGVFAVTRDTVAGYHSPNKIKVTNGAANAAINTYGTAEEKTNSAITTDTTSSLKAKTTVTFSGKTLAAESIPFTVASATYSYTGDDDIDPNTSDNLWYYADVTLTITTT